MTSPGPHKDLHGAIDRPEVNDTRLALCDRDGCRNLTHRGTCSACRRATTTRRDV